VIIIMGMSLNLFYNSIKIKGANDAKLIPIKIIAKSKLKMLFIFTLGAICTKNEQHTPMVENNFTKKSI